MFDIKRQKWGQIGIILLIIFLAAIFRIRAYQDGLSIGTSDTKSYIQSANLPLFSIDFFTAKRPFPISLFYKVLQPDSGYDLILINRAWLGTDHDRIMQPGLDSVAIAQSLISIIAWSTLALVIALKIRHFVFKIASVLLILTFSFSPQLADWDGILMSESLSFSLFALMFAFFILLVFYVVRNRVQSGYLFYSILILWMIFMSLWVFIRDSNAYILLITIFFWFILFHPHFRTIMSSRAVMAISIILFSIFILHNISLRASDRWINPLFNNILKNILPVEEHVQFMQNLGMPVTDEMYALMDSPGNELGFFEMEELLRWTKEEGYSSYTKFLATHPAWAFDKLINNLDLIFVSNRQPYFRGTPESTPLFMLPIGDILHIRSSCTIYYDFLLTLFIVIIAIRKMKPHDISWAFIAIWLFISEIFLLFISYHGDSLGVERHALVAVMPLRLSVWLLTCIFCDLTYSYIKRDLI